MDKERYSLDDLINSLKTTVDNEDNNNLNLDELIEALKTENKDKIKMYMKQVEVNDLKDEYKGLDPLRGDDIFDDKVSVHEVIKALEKYQETKDFRELRILLTQYEVNKLKEKNNLFDKEE